MKWIVSELVVGSGEQDKWANKKLAVFKQSLDFIVRLFCSQDPTTNFETTNS